MRSLTLAFALQSCLAFSSLFGKEDASPGETLWEFQADGRVMATAAMDAARVYFGTASESASDSTSTLHCLDREAGTEVWSQTFPNWLQAGPAITNTRVFIGCDDTKLYCLDKETGEDLWQVDTAGRIDSTPCVDTPGNCYFGSRDRFFYAVNPNGQVLWSRFLTQGVASSPLLDEREGRLYVADLSNTIYAFTLSGEEVWRYKPRQGGIGGVRLRIYSSPTIDDEGILYVGSGDMNLYAVDRRTGQLFWREPTGGVLDSSPVISADKHLYVANREGVLFKYLIDPLVEDREVWRNESIGQVFYGSPTIDSENNIYICGAPAITDPETEVLQTQLSYIDRFSGEILWSARYPGYTDATPTLDVDGNVYLGTAGGSFFKVNGAGNALAETSWPTFRGQSSGAGRYEETYRDWLIRFSIPPEFATTDRDSDKDGFLDFDEFVLGAHPRDPTSRPSRMVGTISPHDDDTQFAFELLKGLKAPYRVETSADLRAWLPAEISRDGFEFEDGEDRWRVQVPLTPPASSGELYYRVRWAQEVSLEP